MDPGEKCPICGGPLWLMSTDNEWKYYCKPCDKRFNERLEPMKI